MAEKLEQAEAHSWPSTHPFPPIRQPPAPLLLLPACSTIRISRAGQISDVAEKLEQAEAQLGPSARAAALAGRALMDKKKEEGALTRVCRDTSKMATEQVGEG